MHMLSSIQYRCAASREFVTPCLALLLAKCTKEPWGALNRPYDRAPHALTALSNRGWDMSEVLLAVARERVLCPRRGQSSDH